MPRTIEPTPEATAAVETALLGEIPGGRYIAQHWQEGPFWLVPISDKSDVNWEAQLLLAAYPRMAKLLIDGAPCDVHAVPQYVREMLDWHNTEYEMTVAQEAIVGPFDHLPTTADLVGALIGWTSDAEDADPEIIETVRALIATFDPDVLVDRLTALDNESEGLAFADRDTVQDLAGILETLAS